MKISIVAHTYPTKYNPSSGIFIQKEARQLSDLFDIEIHLPRVYSTIINNQYYRNRDPITDNFRVHQFKYFSIPYRKLPSITQKSLSSNLLITLESTDPDIIHLHGIFPAGLATPALKKNNYSVILTIHGSDWYSNLKHCRLSDLLYNSLNSCDALITVGNQLKQDIIETYPDWENKIHFVPHGIDTNKFLPPSSKSALKKELHWDTNKLNLLSVANLYKVKGVHVLLKAFNELKNKENYHLHIVSPHFDKDYKNEVLDYIKKNTLDPYITFYDSMPEAKIILYYQAADLFISPSLKEAFGLAIAESAACGTPVIATKSGGPESIVTNEIGRLIPPDDVECLSETIEDISKNLENFDRQKMHCSIVSRYSISAKQNTMKKLYQSILQ